MILRPVILSKTQWQVLQLVLEQVAQPEDPEDGVKLLLLLNEQADIRRLTSSWSQCGHATLSSPPKTRVSNSSSHCEHIYS